jgi:hypothetical protein
MKKSKEISFPQRACKHTKIYLTRFLVGFFFLCAWISGSTFLTLLFQAVAPNHPLAGILICFFMFLLCTLLAIIATTKDEHLLGMKTSRVQQREEEEVEDETPLSTTTSSPLPLETQMTSKTPTEHRIRMAQTKSKPPSSSSSFVPDV